MRGRESNLEKPVELPVVPKPSSKPSMAKPLLCLIDLEDSAAESIREKGYNVAIASFGQPVNVPNKTQGD